MEELKALEKWCEQKINLMSESLNKRLITNRQRERIKNQIIGMDKVVAQIRKRVREDEAKCQ